MTDTGRTFIRLKDVADNGGTHQQIPLFTDDVSRLVCVFFTHVKRLSFIRPTASVNNPRNAWPVSFSTPAIQVLTESSGWDGL